MAALELVSFSREPPRFPSAAAAASSPLPSPRWKWNPLIRCLRLPRRPVILPSSRMAQPCRSNTGPGLVSRTVAAAASSSSSSSSSSPSFSSGEVVMVGESKRDPLGGLVDAALRALKALRKPAAAVLLLGLLLAADPYAALAASGGRMGGRSFSSSSPSFSSSRSYSVPSGSSFSFSTPYYYAPSPFFGGGGGLFVGFGAGSGFFLLMAGFAAVVLFSGFLSDRSDDGSVLTATQKTSVLKLQVRDCSFL
ncbi:hypothetical protein Taro_015800 [Colocasia esculenta]|uniref:Uncharacterized protein n=1 Tax=Colocasia esculenta TaxID=4460 RepID=A0A843UIG3_COLES|nr:hypothetical protein [Colocasia esculenta]